MFVYLNLCFYIVVEDQSSNQQSSEQQQQNVVDGQFRQPLPVSPIVRARPPIAAVDSRTRLILQNPPGSYMQYVNMTW